MYVQAYLDLSLEVSCFLLFILPWTRATGSLAGGFLVAVVGCAPVAVAVFLLL